MVSLLTKHKNSIIQVVCGILLGLLIVYVYRKTAYQPIQSDFTPIKGMGTQNGTMDSVEPTVVDDNAKFLPR